jgi:hypothetical protein
LREKTEVDIQTEVYNNCTEPIYSKGVSDGTEVDTKNDEYMWNRRNKHMVK